MKDFMMLLDEMESAKIGVCLGEIPSTPVSVFVWAESSDKMSMAITIKGDEKIVLEVSDRGNRIEVKKQPNQHMHQTDPIRMIIPDGG